MKFDVARRFTEEFGAPLRDVVKVNSWDVSGRTGVVLQMDQPSRENAAYVWLPYPNEGQAVPEIAIEYPGEAGRHSGTYPAAGLRRGEPAMKLTIRDAVAIDEVANYIRAMASRAVLPAIGSRSEPKRAASRIIDRKHPICVEDIINSSMMPAAEPVKPRREAIPRLIQREVWQRDGGRCVECSTRERLCFDHIVPF